VPTGRTASLEAALALLERSIGYTRGSLALVTPRLLDRPTPCSDWDLLALLRHMDDSLQALLEATDRGYVALSPPGDGEPVGLLLERIRTRACSVLGGWTHQDGAALVSIAGSPLSAALTATAGALEVAVHGWDVATTCGHDAPLPSALAEELLDLAPRLVTDADRPARFAPPVTPPSGSPSDRLLGFLGRRSPPERSARLADGPT
jgi:uncharacterized protein (TIGR03086 family)